MALPEMPLSLIEVIHVDAPNPCRTLCAHTNIVFDH